MFNFKAKQLLTRDVGIDLGTTSVIVCVDSKGIVIREPSVVAVNRDTDMIEKIGKEAQAMLGRSPANIEVIRPLAGGGISKYEITKRMIEYFIRRACGNSVMKPRILICLPAGTTEVEEMAIIDAGTRVGKVFIMSESVAAAIGAGIDVSSPVGHMVVDIGGGTTDVAVVSLGGVVVSESKKVAGDKLDEAIMRYVRRKYNTQIGDRTAEYVKRKIGAVYEHGDAVEIQVKGRCLLQGLPKEITLSSKEMLEAMMDPISEILDTICSVIEKTPPELVGDILKNGIVLAGGGSMLYGLDKLIEDVTGIKTKVAKEPMLCVANGMTKVLGLMDEFSEQRIDLSKIKQKI